eukprot:TRINITY_DN8181_c0_g2_i1.p1 TRINITY_DN8181_c0_g2~~TRINITY_DN8181_c0_g2_i1.p1  ORF type:complete len:341 (+),score=73.26 TRINITY_DN8181_c0_g2_i1:163-1185(+)
MNTVSRVMHTNDPSNSRLRLDQLQLIDNQQLLNERDNEYKSPTLMSGYNKLFDEPDSESSGSRESCSDEEEPLATTLNHDLEDAEEVLSADNDDSSQPVSIEDTSDHFLPDDDPSEEYSAESLVDSRSHRYSGHPLGVQELEMQEELILREKAETQERFYNELRQKQSQWSLVDSRARAKILVSEAYFKERQHIQEQQDHLIEKAVLGRSPRYTRRFKANHAFRDAGFGVYGAHILNDGARHTEAVLERKRTLEHKWISLGKQVENDMAVRDNFPTVIRNLSVMRIFLEGQQSMAYSPSAAADSSERHRRYMNYQNVIQTVMLRNDGYFLRDALPRGEPL